MTQHPYDLLVIGAGAAGSTAATIAAKNGFHVTLIERDKIGGTCLNYGCDPTKTLLHIAHICHKARHADRYGLCITDVRADWSAVMEWVQQVILRIRGGTSKEASQKLAQQGIEVITGEAVFLSPHEVEVAGQVIAADRIIIATGSKMTIPSIEGLQDVGYITNKEAVALPQLFRRLAIVGGGAVGLEFAQMFSRFGVDVTVLEHGEMLLDKEDRELANQLCDVLSKEGMRLETNVELLRVERKRNEKQLTLRCGKRTEETLVVDELLLAIGRQPAFDSLHLEAAGVKTEKRGIVVDATLRTSVPHIWAAGDVAGGYQFTHVAYEQGKLAAQNAFADHPSRLDDQVIPWVTFTDPALAHVGKTEEQLREEGRGYRVVRKSMGELERAIAEDATDGQVKLLLDKNNMLLGGHILAPSAGDMLAPVVLAMYTNLPAQALASAILPYPTMSEAVRWAADASQ